MKSELIILYAMILTLLIIPAGIRVRDTYREEENQIVDLNNNAEGTSSALLNVNFDEDQMFRDVRKREEVFEKYYDIIAKNYGWVGNKEAEKYQRVPVMVLSDWDGFYVRFYNGGSNAESYKNYTTTDLIPYSKIFTVDNSSYMVRFFLKDKLEITKITPVTNRDLHDEVRNLQMPGQPAPNLTKYETFKGSSKEVIKYLRNNGHNDLGQISFISNKDEFLTKRKEIFGEIIEEKVNYYIEWDKRNSNVTGNQINFLNIDYSITIPGYDDYDRKAIKYPFIAAMIQGDQSKDVNGYGNSYSWTASQFAPQEMYDLTVNTNADGKQILIYHKMNACSQVNPVDVIGHATAEGAAKQGAEPCKCVYKGGH